MASLDLLFHKTCYQQNWNLTLWHLCFLVDQHIAKNCLIRAQFYSFKCSTKQNNLEAT